MERLYSDDLIINKNTLPVISQLAERIPGGFFIYRAYGDQELIYFNSYLPAIYGCEDDSEFREFVGNSFKGIVYRDDYDRTEEDIIQQINSSVDKVDHVRYRFIRKDGSIGMIDDYGHFSHSETFGDIYYVFVQDITKEYREEQERKENIARIMALEDNFLSMYDLEIETGRYELYVKKHVLDRDRVEIMVYNDDFFGDTVRNAELVIYPEDRDGIVKVLNRDFIVSTLEKKDCFDWYYRLVTDKGPVWARMRFVYKDDEKKNVIVGVFNAETEMSSKQRAEQTRNELITRISGSESTYIVNPNTDTFTVIGQNQYLREHYHSDETYSESITRYIENDVFETDRKIAHEGLALKRIVRNLEDEKEYVFRYRDYSGPSPRWYEMSAVRLSEDEILLGFSDRDMDTIGQLIFARMRGTYFGLYYVNLDVGLARIVKTGHPDITGEAGDTVPYTELVRSISGVSEGDTAEFLNRFSDIDTVRDYFGTNEVGYYVYKSYFFSDTRWVAVTGLVLTKHENGVPSDFAIGFSLLDDDASEKEEAKLKLQEITEDLEAERFRNDTLHDIIHSGKWAFYVNANDEIVGSNVSLEADRIIRNDVPADGHSWLNIVHPDDRAAAAEAFNAAIRDHSCNTPYDVNYRMIDRNGEYRWFHSAGRMLRYEDGSGEFFGIHVDITDQIEDRQRLDEMARIAAEASNKAKTEFLFNMSHDIRTPMNAILGYTDIALKHVDSPGKVRDSLTKIKMSGGHLLKLINEILEMSRIEAGKIEIVKTPTYVMETAENVKAMCQALASTKDIRFNAVVRNIDDPYVYADELHANQIVINLVSNAIKYTNPGGTVEYVFEQVGAPVNGTARYRFTVRDNGIGMTEEFQKHLFESFAREESAAVSQQEGTGLGLAIVKKIVDLLGGSISVQSQKDVGSVFVVELFFDVMDEEAIRQYKAKSNENEISVDSAFLMGRKALLVEDNQLNREIATEILHEVGLEVETADCGEAAIRSISDKGADYYDFVFMDIQMPVMNGYEATARIRELPNGSRLPIIALSANAFAEDKAASLAAGMDAHVAKPIDVKELITALAEFR